MKKNLIAELYTTFKLLGADHQLLGVIGSWADGDDEHLAENLSAWNEATRAAAAPVAPAPAPEKPAFHIEHRGFVAEGFYGTGETGRIVVTKDGQLHSDYPYPGYKIWNVAAHFAEMVDDELAAVAAPPQSAAPPDEEAFCDCHTCANCEAKERAERMAAPSAAVPLPVVFRLEKAVAALMELKGVNLSEADRCTLNDVLRLVLEESPGAAVPLSAPPLSAEACERLEEAIEILKHLPDGDWKWRQEYEVADEVHWAISTAHSRQQGRIAILESVLFADYPQAISGLSIDQTPFCRFVVLAHKILRQDLADLLAVLSRLQGELAQIAKTLHLEAHDGGGFSLPAEPKPIECATVAEAVREYYELDNRTYLALESRADKLQADVTRLQGERDALEHRLAEIYILTYACGQIYGHGQFEGGCGKPVAEHESYRCSDCSAAFHRECIRKHFKSHAAAAESARAELLAALRWIPISEDLPAEDSSDGEVEVKGEGFTAIAIRAGDSWFYYDFKAEDTEYLRADVTHWRKIARAEAALQSPKGTL